MALLVVVLLSLFWSPLGYSWNDGAVLLRDIQALTLYRGRYTTARRSSPIPQLQCVGGSAGCSAYVPDVVQCQNKGWDGLDVQWECKADMDNWYRFGKVEVSCEGYNSPDDPYILSGSCGLEYTLELTAEGRQKRGSSGFFDSASGFFQGKQQHGSNRDFPGGDSGEGFGSMLVIAFLLLLAFGVYKMFLCDSSRRSPGNQGPDGAGYSNMGPPPPGFRSDFTDPPPAYGFTDSYGTPNASSCGGTGIGGGNRGGGGFWSGMGTGGLLGYLLGSRRRGPTVSPFGSPYSHTNTSSRYSSSSTGSNSGTGTASGFGGTKRR